MSSQSGGGAEDDSSMNLPDSDEFWRLLLGRKYDNMSSSERTDENLLNEIYRRDGDIIDSVYGSKQGLLSELQSDDSDPETVLSTVWAESKWQQKSPGDRFEFEVPADVEEELERIPESNFVVDRLQRDLIVIWVRKQVSRPRESDQTVRSYLDDDWSPLFGRLIEPTLLEIRGQKRRQNQLGSEFAEEGTAQKVLKERADESVLDDLSKIFGEELESLDLVEVRFRQSKLPDGSQLTIRNSSGVQDDLQDDSINPTVVSPQIASKIAYLKFRDQRSDNIAKIKVERLNRGFSFEIQASYIDDEETEAIKEVIESKFNISFEKVYPYHLQYQTDFILHQILSGSNEAYDTYYDELEDHDQELIDPYLNYEEGNQFVCWGCRTEYDEEPGVCEECGNESFEPMDTLSIDHEEIFEDVLSQFSDIDTTVVSDERDVKLQGVHIEETEVGTSQYIRTLFRRTQDSGQGGLEATQDYRYEYFIHPLSSHKPQRIGQYLLNTVFVTYGTAFEQELESFGTINLIDLLRSDDPGGLLVEAVEKSHRGAQDRYRMRSKKAAKSLRQLQSKVDTGILEHYGSEDGPEDDFLDGYSAKKFERDVFHLLKSIFNFTERWGREGRKETDGCLIIPDGDQSYWVGGYDPKLTTDVRGYNIRSTEKDKVVYYVLEESNREYISDVLKRGDPIDAHIFVSDIFREGQFEPTVERVRDWFTLVEGDDTDLEVPIIFLRVEHLLDLYDIFESNYTFLREYSGVMETFRQEVISELSADGGYIEFDAESCARIKKRLIQELDTRNKDRDVQDYDE
ncbi:hypothetical protein [Halarchaeum nitratireducens]|uniref:Uncharacterized protein n=1 Tax=Halarchaeum nitratireducens TaxID=489913 RepID=A0A830GEB8_9EURY|nr:hypothetical protein [Halarchaeum nitratireducens]GGN25415.1 hypothetical protein GCM10009021_29260 [Halarchaeum nitratireducens]